jgi:hypothetical protein
MSEALRHQISVELRYHQQQVDRLTKMLALCGAGVPNRSSSTSKDGSVLLDTPMAVYKKRTQTPEARRKIGDFQRERHRKIREERERQERERQAKAASGKPSGKPVK